MDVFGSGVGMGSDGIIEKLVARGRSNWEKPAGPVNFTPIPEADQLINDLDGHAHHFVLACLMDRQIEAERAWSIPYRLGERAGSWEFDGLEALSFEDVAHHMSEPDALHWLWKDMAAYFFKGLKKIKVDYGGVASNIWTGSPSSATLVRRFLEFDGAGPKIATMAANILVNGFRLPVSDRFSIDISADRQVQRVFARLGLARENASPEEVVYRAREMNPEYPGLIDFAVWELGRETCRPKQPVCDKCFLGSLCPRVGVGFPRPEQIGERQQARRSW